MNTLRVNKAVNGLTQGQRELLKLFVLGFTCKQIAEQEGRRVADVQRELSDIYAQLLEAT